MYTPTPSHRRSRPRPPSQSRTRPSTVPAKKREAVLYSNPGSTNLSHHSSSSSNSERSGDGQDDDTPLTAQMKRRREIARSEASRGSGSPTDVADISIGLEEPLDSSRRSNLSENQIRKRPASLTIPSPSTSRGKSSPLDPSEAEPSPPPPYGTSLPSSSSATDNFAPSPLAQELRRSTHHSPASSRKPSADKYRTEERLRARRAMEAARVMGLDVDFGTSGTESRLESEEDMSEGTLKAQLLDMKRQLRNREKELLLAAEVASRAFRTHEDLLSHLPPTVKARLPEAVHLFPQAERRSQSRSSRAASESSAMSDYPSDSRRRPRPAGRQPTDGRYDSYRSDSVQTYTESSGREESESQDDFMTADDEPGLLGRHKVGRSTSRQAHLPQNHGRPAHRHASHSSISSRPAMSPRQAQFEALRQQEIDDRIMALEQALNDAREGEESQRKLAARLRKEVDKLHRDFERVESVPIHEGLDIPTHQEAHPMTPRIRVTMEKDVLPAAASVRPPAANRRSTPANDEKFGWGSISFPQFPTVAGLSRRRRRDDEEEEDPDLGDGTDRLRKLGPDGRRSKALSPALSQASSTHGSQSTETAPYASDSKPNQQSSSRIVSGAAGSSRGSRQVRQAPSQSSLLDVRRQDMVTTPRHARSPTPQQPTLTVEMLDTESSGTSSSRSSSRDKASSNPRNSRKSPWPSPPGSIHSTLSPHPRTTLDFMASRPGSLSPAFASLSSRMASMRAFVTTALDASPSRPVQRSLGSELGSEYGDQPEGSLRFIENALFGLSSPAGTHLTADEDGRSVISEGYFQSPAPLPAGVSAALSSLALALAPYTSPAPPRVVVGPPRPGSSGHLADDEEMNVFDETFAMRKIRWADTTRSGLHGNSSEEGVVTESVFSLPRRKSQALATSSRSAASGFQARSPLGSRREKQVVISPRPPMRPANLRHSSDGSVALAHRRRLSQQASLLAGSQIRHDGPLYSQDIVKRDEDEEWQEPTTIPGRLVHDILCLLAILVDFIECAVVIIYRVIIDMRYGQRDSLLGINKRARMKRYYL